MKVVIFAAGVGARLAPEGRLPPKALLRFGAATLLRRHLELLRHFGLKDVSLVVGHRAELIERELEALGVGRSVRTLFNPDYRASSLLSLWAAREVLAAGAPVLTMDADVLYDWRLLALLLEARQPSAILIDRRTALDDEAVKVCVRGGQIVDFHKQLRVRECDFAAEWVGFARFDAEQAAALVAAARRCIATGRSGVIYEEPIRDVLTAAPKGAVGIVDAAGLPWIEIDFPDDLARARTEIWPRLVPLPDAPAARHRTAVGCAPRPGAGDAT